jgi:hypothetical protein
MIPYYAALARVGMGDIEGAAVEARRLSLLLQVHSDDDEQLDTSLEATLRYLAGALFEAHGDRNDSDVAYRNALALDSTLALPPTPASATGSVIVILEQGFVAHRVEQGLSVLLLPEEVDLIANGESDERSGALAFVAARTLHEAARSPFLHEGLHRPTTLFVPPPEDPSLIPRRRPKVVCRTVEEPADSNGTASSKTESRQECTEEEPELDELPYLLKVAWPVYRTDSRAIQGAHLIGAGDTIRFQGNANLSRSVVSDFQAERALIIARTVARGAAKLAITKGAEKKLEDRNETAGRIIGLLGNLGNALLERADTRSWHLLPAGISIARVQLAPGEHSLSIAAGERTIALEPVTVQPGGVSVVSARAW